MNISLGTIIDVKERNQICERFWDDEEEMGENE